MNLLSSLKSKVGVSPSLQVIAVIWGPRTGLSPTGILLDLFQGQDVRLQNDPSFIKTLLDEFAVGMRVFPMSGDELRMKLKAEACLPRFSPSVQSRLAKPTEELRRLLDVQVAIAIPFDVNFPDFASHPETRANSDLAIQPEITFAPDYVPHPNSGPDGFFD